MKRLVLTLILACMVAWGAESFGGTNSSQAQKGGFISKTPKFTVAQAKKAKDDTRVVLQGKIIREVEHEKYEFADDTGVILIDIDDKIWRGLSVTTDDLIEIEGYIDDDDVFEPIEVEVKRINKLK